ncbi:Fic/DOC family protein [Arthrobacter cryoconiti]|uniref:protein adenylyltransferase n=1 Tax=Arthrobacter cryoconiti TaxID=748907 RepID=A0ABV8R1V8_9MICC|nr:Fic family protein [Arthrobacter cryoconiti]MCC9067830.1 Fic family protein [Arthrobacter cryoconiti]
MADRYTYPNSPVLRNKLNVVDQSSLDRLEHGLVELALADLLRKPEAPTFRLEHLKAIHRRLFSELYEWAGTLRETDKAARGSSRMHVRPEFLESAADDVFAALEAENFLTGLDQASFAPALARHWGALAALDPFRHGNICSQAVLLDQMATQAGWNVNWKALDPDWIKEARMAAAAGDPGLLAKLISPALTSFPA